MKRLFIAFAILSAGSGSFLALQSATRDLEQTLAQTKNERAHYTGLADQADQVHQSMTSRATELGAEWLAENARPRINLALTNILSGDSWKRLSPEQQERIFAELGLAWETSNDYVLVSKKILKSVAMPGISAKGELTETVCAVLAITPEEKATVELELQKAVSDRTAWLKLNLERLPLTDKNVAHYRVAFNPEHPERARKALSILGQERASILHHYTAEWLQQNGFGPAENHPVELTVRREQGGKKPVYSMNLKTGSASTGANLYSFSFPELFRPLFPNGWEDLAAQEGFKLPDDFQ